jgi:hypothetical protein
MQDDDKVSEAARRLARAKWPVTIHRLGDDPPPDATTAEQRLAMMCELTVQAWALAGLPIPDYDRAHTPVRVMRGGRAGDT